MAETTRQEWTAGTRVQVRNRFTHDWSSGFEVAERAEDALRIRRLSDNAVLPLPFEPAEVRAER
jgi:hypothetical protein